MRAQERRCSPRASTGSAGAAPSRAAGCCAGCTAGSCATATGRQALHPGVRPVGPAAVRRPRRRPVRGCVRRGAREVVTDAIERFVARGHPADERRAARGRRRRDGHGPADAAVRRHRARRSTASRSTCASGTSTRALMLTRRARTSRSASATPTRAGRCGPTCRRGWFCRVLRYLDRHDLAVGDPALRRAGARGAAAARPHLGLRAAGDRTCCRARGTAARGGCGRTT